jgi:uncharacterized protein DUF3306
MSPYEPSSRGFSLRRWSRRKLDAARAAAEAPPAAQNVPAPVPPSVPPGQAAAPIADAAPLPAIESLTIDSDFGAFLGAEVDEKLKLQALKRLFSDPHFNVMDGLDTYIDDYSIPDPIAPNLVRQLTQARYIFDPPRTRVNEAGVVEDVPADDAAVDADAPAVDALPESPPTSIVPAAPSAGADVAAEAEATDATPREGSEPARR